MNNAAPTSPARLTRFVDNLAAPYVCQFDAVKNILRIQKPIFDTLSESKQKQVWRAKADIVYK